MITFTKGNLLDAKAEVLVNTVNTVGVMGKGIALMFKERFTNNFRLYSIACKAKEVQTGKMFVTQVNELGGVRWIVNFPTKQHWRSPSKIEWIVAGLKDLRDFLVQNDVKSIAIPPLGAGNGGLDWAMVRAEIESILADVETQVVVFEPADEYQNVSKRTGVKNLTPARALIAELVRRYWVLGMDCSLLEIQKLAWFLERTVERMLPDSNPLKLQFVANKYGPYADRLRHVLNDLDGSYLHCARRISDAEPSDVIWFDDDRKLFLQTYIQTEAKTYSEALESTIKLISGFESPFGMELLATVDWLLFKQGTAPSIAAVRHGIKEWPAGAAARKAKIFDDRAVEIALTRLVGSALHPTANRPSVVQ